MSTREELERGLELDNQVIKAAIADGIDFDILMGALEATNLLTLAGDNYKKNKGITTNLRRALTAARKHARWDLLLKTIANDLPHENKILAVTHALVVSQGGVAKVAGFEVLLNGEPFADPSEVARKLLETTRQVCRVSGASGGGTGFLVGADRVLTARHVVTPGGGATCTFDLVDGRTPRDIEGTVEMPLPVGDDDDYAFIRLDEPLGREPGRGWIEIERRRVPKLKDAVIVVQHPENKKSGGQQPMRMQIGSVTRVASKELEYTANTLRGSSGSPVLGLTFELLAVHRKAGNVGVLIDYIAKRALSTVPAGGSRDKPKSQQSAANAKPRSSGQSVAHTRPTPSAQDDLDANPSPSREGGESLPVESAAPFTSQVQLPSHGINILHISDLYIPQSAIRKGAIEHAGWKTLWNSWSRLNPDEKTRLCLLTGDLSDFSSEQVAAAVQSVLVLQCEHLVVVPGDSDIRSRSARLRDGGGFAKVFGSMGLGTSRSRKRDERPGWQRAWWAVDVPLLVFPLDSNVKPTAKKGPSPKSVAIGGSISAAEQGHLATMLNEVEASITEHYRAVVGGLTDDEAIAKVNELATAFSTTDLKTITRSHILTTQQRAALSTRLARLHMSLAARAVMMHHHPIAFPAINPAEASIPVPALDNASEVFQRLYEHDIDLVCHGHAHRPHAACVRFGSPLDRHIGVVTCGPSAKLDGVPARHFNEIEVTALGEVEVRLHQVSRTKPLSALEIRSWSDVKKSMAREARKLSRIEVRRLISEMQILPTGDAEVTNRYIDLNNTPGRRGTIDLPIRFQSASHAQPPHIADKVNVASVELDTWVQRDGTWIGVLRITPESSERPVSLTVQTISLCAFAVNRWQCEGLYGAEAPLSEWYGFELNVPVTQSMSLSVHAWQQQLFNVKKGARTIDGLPNDRETEAMELVLSAKGTHASVTVPAPVWTHRYGIQWTLQEHNYEKGQPSCLSAPSRNCLDAVHRLFVGVEAGIAAGATRQALETLFADPAIPTDVEVTLYALVRGESGAFDLRQMAWNALAHRAKLQTVHLPFGVGVAGRAASLARDVPWVALHGPQSHSARFADYYLRNEDQQHVHEGVLCMPIAIGSDKPVAVLSLATVNSEGSFYRDVADAHAAFQRDELRADAYTSGWLGKIRSDVARIMRELKP